ncbi:YhhA family cyclophane-containing RiPP [uncultured Fibrella sp.]|uniref:YhhA family cyclophane-containing RiPP n=1 Tax=uncultured Fibrella sp. TaxID=1284596 RepID=UPI0035CBE0FD
MENKVASNNQQVNELAQTLKQHAPSHPALNRMKAKLVGTGGIQAISGYDRMHHRHNRA